MSSTPLFLFLFLYLKLIVFFSVKYLSAVGAFGEHAREELNSILMKYKSKLSLNKKNNVHRLQKASTSSEIATKVKKKVNSLTQRAFADKNKLVSQESKLGN